MSHQNIRTVLSSVLAYVNYYNTRTLTPFFLFSPAIFLISRSLMCSRFVYTTHSHFVRVDRQKELFTSDSYVPYVRCYHYYKNLLFSFVGSLLLKTRLGMKKKVSILPILITFYEAFSLLFIMPGVIV